MRQKRRKASPLPEGWLDEFLDRADLDQSYAELRGRRHFYVEGWRGYIKSQQFDFDRAWKHFDRAQELSQDAVEDIPNLIRQFMVNIWCFECTLLENPVVEAQGRVPPLWMPELPETVLREYPEVQLVIDLRLHSEAVLRLHLGEWDEATGLYERLLEGGKAPDDPQLPGYYLGLAACKFNQGFEELAREHLQNAGFAVLSNGRTINRARIAALLFGLHAYMESYEEARDWRTFLQQLDCPQATKDIFLRFGMLLLERCTERSSLLVF